MKYITVIVSYHMRGRELNEVHILPQDLMPLLTEKEGRQAGNLCSFPSFIHK